jgi:hypothetical protein
MSFRVQRSISSETKNEEKKDKISSFSSLPEEIKLYILEIFFKFNEQPLLNYKNLRLVCRDFKELSYQALQRVFSSRGLDAAYLKSVLGLGLLDGVKQLYLRKVTVNYLEQCQLTFNGIIDLRVQCHLADSTLEVSKQYSIEKLTKIKEVPGEIVSQVSRIFPQMNRLNLSNQSGVGLTTLTSLSILKLSYLDLSGTSTSLNALKTLTSLKETLTFLNLNGCKLSIDLPEPELLIQKDHVMAFLSQFEKLTILKIRDWFLKKQDVSEFLKLKNLEEIEVGLDLSVDRDSFIEISSLKNLATVLFNLKQWASSQDFPNKFYRASVWQSVTLVAKAGFFSELKLSNVEIEEI